MSSYTKSTKNRNVEVDPLEKVLKNTQVKNKQEIEISLNEIIDTKDSGQIKKTLAAALSYKNYTVFSIIFKEYHELLDKEFKLGILKQFIENITKEKFLNLEQQLGQEYTTDLFHQAIYLAMEINNLDFIKCMFANDKSHIRFADKFLQNLFGYLCKQNNLNTPKVAIMVTNYFSISQDNYSKTLRHVMYNATVHRANNLLALVLRKFEVEKEIQRYGLTILLQSKGDSRSLETIKLLYGKSIEELWTSAVTKLDIKCISLLYKNYRSFISPYLYKFAIQKMVERDNIQGVEVFLSKIATQDDIDLVNETILIAVSAGKLNIVKLVLEKCSSHLNVDIESKIFNKVSDIKNEEMIKLLNEYGISKSYRTPKSPSHQHMYI